MTARATVVLGGGSQAECLPVLDSAPHQQPKDSPKEVKTAKAWRGTGCRLLVEVAFPEGNSFSQSWISLVAGQAGNHSSVGLRMPRMVCLSHLEAPSARRELVLAISSPNCMYPIPPGRGGGLLTAFPLTHRHIN